MRIAIVGATGTAGTLTTAAARERGYDVVELSRASGIDLLTGAGLEAALTGADAVIDTSNAFPTDPDADVVEALAGGTRHVVEAARAVGVERLVFLSICNIERSEFDQFPYYLAKRAQERAVRASGLPATVVRSTQWHEFATNPAAVVETEDVVRVQNWLVQPIAAATVASVLIDAVASSDETRSISGPEVIALPELAQRLRASRGDARKVEAAPPFLDALADGILLAPLGAELLGPTVEEWLATS